MKIKHYTNEISRYMVAQKCSSSKSQLQKEYFWDTLYTLGQEYSQVRNYSLSDIPSSEVYRITVKKEADGAVSTYLHDTLEVFKYHSIYLFVIKIQ